jgi:hypothetical protein
MVEVEVVCQVEEDKHVIKVESVQKEEAWDNIDNADEKQVCRTC